MSDFVTPDVRTVTRLSVPLVERARLEALRDLLLGLAAKRAREARA